MLENLQQLVTQFSQEAIIDNPAIDNSRNKEAISAATASVYTGLHDTANNGGLKQLLNMFGNGDIDNSAITQKIQNNYANTLTSKFNVDAEQAQGIAGGMIPDILKNLVNKTNDTSDSSFNLQDIFQKLSGGNAGGLNFNAIIDKYKSGAFDKDGDGDTDLQDAVAVFKGGNIFDNLKSMFL